MLDSAAYDSTAQKLMFRKLVTNDEEFQVFPTLALLELCFQNRKGLDNPCDIFVWFDVAGIKKERVLNLVALQNSSLLLHAAGKHCTVINRVVDYGNLAFWYRKDSHQVTLGS